jgi:hypothetical protein
MPRLRVATFQLAIGFILVFGLMALSFWSGTTISDWPQKDPSEADAISQDVYGYVSVELPQPVSLLRNPAMAERGYSSGDAAALAIEQRSQAVMLTSRSLLTGVVQDSNLALRNTKWFKPFKHPLDARRWLERHFHAKSFPESKVIRVSLDPIDPPMSEARTIVMDIVNKHLEEQRKLQQSKTLDRASALNQLKTKYENRMRELSDRRNNRLVRMQMTDSGSDNRTTVADLELKDAIAQLVTLTTVDAAARSKLERLQAKKDAVDPAALRAAEDEALRSNATLEAIQKRLETLKSVTGDLAIAMSDYVTTVDDLNEVHKQWREIRDELDVISATNVRMAIDWAQYPTIRDE